MEVEFNERECAYAFLLRERERRTFTSQCEGLGVFVLTLVLVVLGETTCGREAVLLLIFKK